MCYKSVPHFTALMRTFGNDFAPRTPLWPHPQQWESGGPPSGGQASDPDTEGDAQHSQSLLELMSCICTLPIFLTVYLADDGRGGALWRLFHTPFSQVSMWVQLQIPKIEDGNNFGVAVQVSTNGASLVLGCVWYQIWIFLLPSGESVWTPDQHTHQDRSLPNPDLKVRVCGPVWQLLSLLVLHNYGNADNFFAFFFSSSPLPQILQREGRRSGQSVQTATRGQSLFAPSQLEKPNFREASLFFWTWHVCSVTGRLQTAGPWAGPVSVLWAPPHGLGHLQHICECVKR